MTIAITAGHARCEDLVESLSFPQPWELHAFIARLARHRGKRILLREVSLGLGHPCGMLVCTAEIDYIYCSSDAGGLHAQHSVLHEVGHLLLEHGGLSAGGAATPHVAGQDAVRRLLPDLAPELIVRMLGRGSYASEQEREAELFASLAMARVSSPRRQYHGVRCEGGGALARLDAAFGMPRHRRSGRAR
jgi:hypothetical protein